MSLVGSTDCDFEKTWISRNSKAPCCVCWNKAMVIVCYMSKKDGPGARHGQEMSKLCSLPRYEQPTKSRKTYRGVLAE